MTKLHYHQTYHRYPTQGIDFLESNNIPCFQTLPYPTPYMTRVCLVITDIFANITITFEYLFHKFKDIFKRIFATLPNAECGFYCRFGDRSRHLSSIG